MIAARALLRCEDDRLPEALEGTIEAAGRQDPDDLVRLAVEHDVVIQDRPVAAETCLPCGMAEDDDVAGAWLIFVGKERTPERSLHAENIEIIGRHEHACESYRIAVRGERDVQTSRGRKRFERRAEPLPVHEIERADPVAGRRRRRFPHADNPFRVGIGQRLQKHGVDQAEHGGVGADADGHHADGHERKPRIPSQEQQAVADVPHERIDPPHAAAVAVLFLHPLDAAEASAGGETRICRRQPCRDAVPLGHLQVLPHLVVELRIELARADERGQPANERHGRHDPASRNRATSAVARCQFATSTRNWRVPAAVRE
jgi:hypothetical protein